MNIRPSYLLARAEDGVVTVAQHLGSGALRVVGAAASAAHSAKLEYKARQLASANVLADQVNAYEEDADRLYIAKRTEALIAKQRKAAQAAKQHRAIRRAKRKAR